MQRICLMLAAGAILVLSTAEVNAQGPIRSAWRRATGRNNVATTYTTTPRTYTTTSRDRILFDGERDFVGRRSGGRTWYASNSRRTFYRTAPAATVVGPATRVDPNVAPASAIEDANTNPERRTINPPSTPRTRANPTTPPRS